VKRGRVRRAKLYYLRGLRGKAARIRERDTRGHQADDSQASAAGKK
jgi:large subunit ribosomal protein L19